MKSSGAWVRLNANKDGECTTFETHALQVEDGGVLVRTVMWSNGRPAISSTYVPDTIITEVKDDANQVAAYRLLHIESGVTKH